MNVDDPNALNSQFMSILLPLSFDSNVNAELRTTASAYIPFRPRHVIFKNVAAHFNSTALLGNPLGAGYVTASLQVPASPLLLWSDLFTGSMAPIAFVSNDQVIDTYTNILVPDSARKDIRGGTYHFQITGLGGQAIDLVPPAVADGAFADASTAGALGLVAGAFVPADDLE